MGDDIDFAVERGTKLGGIGVALITAGAATGPVGLSVGLVTGLLGFAANVLGLFAPGDPPPDETFVERLDAVEQALSELSRQVTALDVRQAIDANQAQLRETRRLLADAQVLADEVRRADAGADWLTLTNRAGALADLLIADGLDLWKWYEIRTPGGRSATLGEVRIDQDQFNTLPTLPAYLLAVSTWVVARERAIKTHDVGAFLDDRGRIDRHHDVLTLRPTFRAGDPRTPAGSLPEHLAWRVRQTVGPRSTWAVDGACTYDIHADNLMTGERTGPDQPHVVPRSRGDWCFVDPYLPSRAVHQRALQDAGAGLLERLGLLLGRLSREGTIADRGSLSTGPHPVALFRLDLRGDLTRITHPGGLAEDGLPAVSGSELWARNWDETYHLVVSAGGRDLLGLDHRRRLVLQTYAGSGAWLDPVAIAHDWTDVIELAGSGDGVLYTRHVDGRLCWWRYTGEPHRGVGLRGPVVLSHDGGRYLRLVGAGAGRLYGLLPDGVLHTLEHPSHLVGHADLTAPVVVDPGAGPGRDWRAQAAIAAIGRTLYGLGADGTLTWHRWGWIRWGLRRGVPSARVPWWSEPRTVATGLNGTQLIVPQHSTSVGPVVR